MSVYFMKSLSDYCKSEYNWILPVFQYNLKCQFVCFRTTELRRTRGSRVSIYLVSRISRGEVLILSGNASATTYSPVTCRNEAIIKQWIAQGGVRDRDWTLTQVTPCTGLTQKASFYLRAPCKLVKLIVSAIYSRCHQNVISGLLTLPATLANPVSNR